MAFNIVSALESVASSLRLRALAGAIVLCSWARRRTLIVPSSLHPGVQMGTGQLNAGGNPAIY